MREKEGQLYIALQPRRLFLLYVPSSDLERLLGAADYFCLPVRLEPELDEAASEYDEMVASSIEWRHEFSRALEVVRNKLDWARSRADELKSCISDKRLCPLNLPAQNYYHPSSSEKISHLYREFSRFNILEYGTAIKVDPTRFSRDQIANIRSSSNRSFFKNARGRIFPEDIYHAEPRLPNPPKSIQKGAISTDDLSEILSQVLLFVRQRFRFGVVARDGKFHYDVQYEADRMLVNEKMFCSVDGHVAVSGSHANVGVNDRIWVPDGTKELLR